nr:unnamed protein product [Callosobruchus chinensis]
MQPPHARQSTDKT